MELSAKLPFSKRRLRPRIVISYIFDYVILIACIIGFYILDSIEPFHQHFSLRNISLQYPYAVHERVPIALALTISGVFPLVLIIIYTLGIDGLFSHHKQDPTSGRRKLRGPYRWKDRLWEMNCGILGLLLAQGLAFVVTQVLKNACGKPRPDLIARCQPPAGSHDEIPGLSNYTICTGDPALIKDGFLSWPSGHSSSSFAGLGYTALWLGGKLHVMDNRGEVWKTLLIMVPLIAATLIAVSRIMDARHHPFDVITGGLLGLITGYVSYRQYFPPITEAWRKGRAYPIRTWGTDPVDPHGNTKMGHFDESAAALRNLDDEQLGSVQSNTTAAPYLGSTNPFVSPAYPRRPHDHDPDGNWSSSEDDVSNVYEMQHGYAVAQNPGAVRSSPQYTGYPPQMMPTGGLSAPSVTVSHPGRGQPLTDPV